MTNCKICCAHTYVTEVNKINRTNKTDPKNQPIKNEKYFIFFGTIWGIVIKIPDILDITMPCNIKFFANFGQIYGKISKFSKN